MADYREMFWYVAPVLVCHGNHQHSEIPLPYADLPQTNRGEWFVLERRNPLELPTDEWQVVFGCPVCGLVDTYRRRDLDTRLEFHESGGRFRSDTNCFCADVLCGRPGCGTPAKVHVSLGPQGGEEGVKYMLQKAAIVGQLPCGHSVAVFRPRLNGNPYRVMNRLW